MDKDLLTISKAAAELGISIDTLRRWDESGRLKAVRSEGGHRYFKRDQIANYSVDIFRMAEDWVLNGIKIPNEYYCADSATFNARVVKMGNELSQSTDEKLRKLFSLIVAAAGEIGNNSFDHNLGNWRDIPGIFFGYDTKRKCIVLADRGQGIFKTLKRVRPTLQDDSAALVVAFTEIVSGRAPEERGNGLKFVRNIVTKNKIELLFKTGNAELVINENSPFNVSISDKTIQGCLSLIDFKKI